MKDLDKIFRHARFRVDAGGADGASFNKASYVAPTPKPASSGGGSKTVSAQPASAPKKSSGGGGGGGGYSYSYSSGGGGDSGPSAQDIIDQINAVAKSAYNRQLKRIQESYDKSKSTYDTNLQSNNEQLAKNASHSRNLVNVDAEDAMRAAYISNMLSRRDMRQWLSAQGLSGGASETMRASLANNYGNARNQIDTGRNRNISDINIEYNNRVSEAIRQYNEQIAQLAAQKAQLEMQAENSYTSNQMSAIMAGLRYA